MTALRTAAQQALEALEDMLGWQSLAPQTIQESAKGRAAALRAALEPCPHGVTDGACKECYCDTHCTWADHAPGCVRAEPLSVTVTELQEALVYANLIDRDAIDDPEGYDEGSTLAQIDALHRKLTAAQGCNPHPKAPHGFLRNASHTEDRYVCECEYWEPYEAGYQAGMEAALAEPVQDGFDQLIAETEADSKGAQALEEGRRWVKEQFYAGAEPVPVAWMHVPYPGSGLRQMVSLIQNREPSLYAASVPLYVAPPQRKPLTEGEIDELSRTMVKGDRSVNWLCRAIERAHGIT